MALLLNTDAQAVLICACTAAACLLNLREDMFPAKRILQPRLQTLPQVGTGGGERCAADLQHDHCLRAEPQDKQTDVRILIKFHTNLG